MENTCVDSMPLAATMGRMAKAPKEPDGPKKPGRKPYKRAGVSVHVYIDPRIRAAAQSFMDNHEFNPDLTAVVSQALKELLERHGYWPPADAGRKPPPAAGKPGKPPPGKEGGAT